MSLREYQAKRHFDRTPEPRGAETSSAGRTRGRSFVVQKHAASHLHYDFRLELEGVLKSWSVPKGPSLDPEVRRLAMETEDHPIAYADFEGVIPQGQYGGGTVIVWDSGTWKPLDPNPHQAYRAGKLRFELHGTKLTGAFTLVRKGKDQRAWLLMKADQGTQGDIVAERPESVVTGRTIEEVAAARDRVWHSNRGRAAPKLEIAGAKRAKPPKRLAVAKPEPSDSVPEGDAFLHELEIPGDRVQAWITSGVVRLLQDGEDVTRRFRAIVIALETTRVVDAILDGVVAGETFIVFDLLRLEGHDLRHSPLEARKAALDAILAAAPRNPHLHDCPHAIGGGAAYLANACKLGARGVVSKRRTSHYGAAKAWSVARCRSESAIAGVEISNPTRVMYPEGNITKWDVARYYEEIGDWIVPHVKGRPLTLVRCGAGLKTGKMREDCTFMKHGRVWGPSTLRRVEIQEKKKVGEYLIADDLPGVIGLVQIDILEIHTWNTHIDHPDRANRIVFDLDPGPDVAWTAIVRAARSVRERLRGLGLESWVKTTGGAGLHVVVPIVATPWESCLEFARALSRELEADDPRTFTTSIVKSRREKKIYLDVLRNNRGNTSVAAYSTRARPEASVSVPIAWDELGKKREPFDIHRVPRRLAHLRADPWAAYFSTEQRIVPS